LSKDTGEGEKRSCLKKKKKKKKESPAEKLKGGRATTMQQLEG
jgi:hypothetical protein